MDIRHAIDTSRMSAYQWVIVAMAAFLNALDGYDVLAMAFTATAVTREFGLTSSELGWLLSAGLTGMAAGSLLLGPLADRYGRQKILLVSLVLNALGLFLSATANSAVELGLWRVLTGLGVGGILATVAVLTSEYSNIRHRGMALSIFTAGYGVGASLGGAGATHLIPSLGWRSVFVVGGILSVLAIGLVSALVPESMDFYRMRRPREVAQRKAAQIARRLGLSGPVEVGAEPAAQERNSVARLFDARYRVPSLLLWAAFFTIMFGFYFANSWTPRLLVESGMSEQQGILGGLMLSMGGTVGSVLYGALTTRWDARVTLMAFTALSAVTLVLFITTVEQPTLAFCSGVVVGMLISGCISGLYTLAPQTYAPDIRASGVGWGIGVGRIGAILAPILVGAFLDAGWTPLQLYIGVAVVVALAAAALWKLRPYDPALEARADSRPTEATAAR